MGRQDMWVDLDVIPRPLPEETPFPQLVVYGALATHVMFELAGRDLKDGNSFSPVDFEFAVPQALGLPTAYRWDSPELEREYGRFGRAPTYLKNATRDYTWGVQAQGLYEATLPLVAPLSRFETRVAKLRKDYPALTGGARGSRR